MHALILGGRGAVGRAARAALQERGHEAVLAGRTIGETEGIPLDLTTPRGRERLAGAAIDVDVVINASGIEDPQLVTLLPETPLVDISATGAYLSELRSLSASATVVLGAGIAPGVSTLLAAALTSADGDDIDVAVMLGTGEAHGPAAVAWTAGLVGTDVHDPADDYPVRNLVERRRFVAAGRRRLHLRADFPDHVLLAGRGLRVRSYLALSSPVATAALAIVGAIPAWRGVLTASPHWGDARWEISATNRRTGEQRTASGIGQSLATGEFTALAAIRAVEDPRRGPVSMADLSDVGLLHDARTVLSTTTRRAIPIG
ncbi:saccharopine dehydrogenase [Microbacterium paraoxydans]|uniref:saccharopine dehydrogenase n=1 Tax=Microbacterium paraoxydans TaxID=199592 RepID=UPI001CFBCA48|nr:saccharopine dehydrogenase [Microbacterium paraoxydans]